MKGRRKLVVRSYMKRLKNICVILMAAVMSLTAICVFPVKAETEPEPVQATVPEADEGTFYIDYTDGTPVLDGVAEELWKDAKELEFGGEVKAKIRIMWNEAFIFIFCEVTDDRVCSADSLDTDNDCLEVMLLTDFPGSEYSFGDIEINKPSEGNYDFLIYNEYKEEALGKTINNNLRDYVVAERCKTDTGYNLEALVKLHRRDFTGDDFLFNCALYDIREENGPVANKEMLKEEGYIRLVTEDTGYRYDLSANLLSFVGMDMKYGFGKEDMENFNEKLCPNVWCFINATEDDIKLIKAKYTFIYNKNIKQDIINKIFTNILAPI